MASGNGAKPQKPAEQVAAELRQQLEQRLGRERTDAIWRDPANVQQVIEGEEEAGAVAEILLRAMRDLPDDDTTAPAAKRGGGFRRGLRIALFTAIVVWGLAILRRSRQRESEDEA